MVVLSYALQSYLLYAGHGAQWLFPLSLKLHVSLSSQSMEQTLRHGTLTP